MGVDFTTSNEVFGKAAGIGMSKMLRLVILAVLLSGCHTDPMTGMGWRTELYTAYHTVQVKEHPKTPIEWQAKANDECVDVLMEWRLSDSNLGWKHSRGMTGCLYSHYKQECVCTAGHPGFKNDDRANRVIFSPFKRWLVVDG